MRPYNRKNANLNKSARQLDAIEKERSMRVYKADELLQKARFTLSLNEQRLILYAISKIKPTDTAFQEYIFDLKDFYAVCGMTGNDSYTKIKEQCKALSDKSWWLTVYDDKGEEWESVVRWFNTLRTNKKNGIVTIKFHEDMFPYLLELSRQREEDEQRFYTGYEFRYVLPMKSTYSIRLYELLKSYQKNNKTWWFKLDKLKHILDCEFYSRYADFRRRVLDPAIKEINDFSDLNIYYETEKDGKKFDVIEFFMSEKTKGDKVNAHKNGLTELDGNIHYWDKK